MTDRDIRILIRGAGELGSATAHHLHNHGFTRILMLDRRYPKAVRRLVCFSETVFDGVQTVQGVTARLAHDLEQADFIHRLGDVAVSVMSLEAALEGWKPHVFIEAAMLHEDWGLRPDLAPIVIALGPGYEARKHCHAVVDTFRGPQVGAVLEDTGDHLENGPPANIMGYSQERVLKAVRDGIFFTKRKIGDEVDRANGSASWSRCMGSTTTDGASRWTPPTRSRHACRASFAVFGGMAWPCARVIASATWTRGDAPMIWTTCPTSPAGWPRAFTRPSSDCSTSSPDPPKWVDR